MSLIFITFIFKMNNTTYYGKYYTDYISPDHEGLDDEIRTYLLKGITEYQKQELLPKIKQEAIDNVQIGVMSVCNETYISLHSTNEERNCFDFHCEKYTINHTICMKMYMFGKLIEN
jgi:hypothetical protein